jgi:hypothetical protein
VPDNDLQVLSGYNQYPGDPLFELSLLAECMSVIEVPNSNRIGCCNNSLLECSPPRRPGFCLSIGRTFSIFFADSKLASNYAYGIFFTLKPTADKQLKKDD